METETDISIDVNTQVSNLALNMESTNTISFRVHYLMREDEEILRHVSSRPICLMKPRRGRGFMPSHISQCLHEQDVPHSQNLGQKIAHDINDQLANDNSLREPVFVNVDIHFIKDERLPCVSREVIQRLVNEQRVKPMDLKETKEIECSICIQDFADSNENIIRMPQCKHMFHEACLIEWLSRQNSCPLCRSTVSYGGSRNKQKIKE